MKDLKGKTFKIEKLDDDMYLLELRDNPINRPGIGYLPKRKVWIDEEEFRDMIDTLAQHVLDGLVHKWKTESISGCN